jgi:hypothetical protein
MCVMARRIAFCSSMSEFRVLGIGREQALSLYFEKLRKPSNRRLPYTLKLFYFTRTAFALNIPISIPFKLSASSFSRTTFTS